MDRAEARDAEGRCIACGKKFDDRTRGLCNADYMRYMRARRKVPKEKIPAFNEALVTAGKLLPSRQGQGKEGSDYMEIAKRFMPVLTGQVIEGEFKKVDTEVAGHIVEQISEPKKRKGKK